MVMMISAMKCNQPVALKNSEELKPLTDPFEALYVVEPVVAHTH